MEFVCPACRVEVASGAQSYRCAACSREYPVIAGIPDFRLEPDPYIGIVEDREKGVRLEEFARDHSFRELLQHYYGITPEDPADLAAHWIRRCLAEEEIARHVLADWIPDVHGSLLDIGCSTGALLAAASPRGAGLVGVDVAFRWLVIGKTRLREAGVDAALVCANAEALPFAEGSFGGVTATDVLEHTRDARKAISEARRVLSPGGSSLWTTNNRWSPLPDPHVHLWGIHYLPVRWQAPYVAWRRRDLHPYRIRLRSAREWFRLFSEAGFRDARVEGAKISAPHVRGQLPLRVYNALLGWPATGALGRMIGPRLRIQAEN